MSYITGGKRSINMKKYHIIEKYRKKNIFQAKIQARAFLFYDVAARLNIILNIYLYKKSYSNKILLPERVLAMLLQL